MYDCYVNMNKCNAERWKRAEDITLVARYSAHMHMCNRNTSKFDHDAYLINKCTCEDFEKRMAKFSFHLHLSLSVSFSLFVGLTTKSISWMRKSSGKVEAHKNIDTRHSLYVLVVVSMPKNVLFVAVMWKASRIYVQKIRIIIPLAH